jgi:aryl sulfotransferase
MNAITLARPAGGPGAPAVASSLGEKMASEQITWPRKTQEIQNRVCDSSRWNEFKFRSDDIIIATFGKTGTTWTQQIVAQLVFGGAEGLMGGPGNVSPWLDMRPVPFPAVLHMLEAQQHRRFVKTHLPVNALVFSPQAKYIYVARDVRDVVWSAYNHIRGFTQAAIDEFNRPPDLGPEVAFPDIDVREFYLEFLNGEGALAGGLWPFWDHVQGWWDIRALPNVLLVHYNQLQADLPGQMRRIASFLDIPIEEALMPKMLEHCHIDYMRRAAASNAESDAMLKGHFKDGANTFFNKGTNGRWKDVLSAAEIALADQVAGQRLDPDCARWLRTGELPEGEG